MTQSTGRQFGTSLRTDVPEKYVDQPRIVVIPKGGLPLMISFFPCSPFPVRYDNTALTPVLYRARFLIPRISFMRKCEDRHFPQGWLIYFWSREYDQTPTSSQLQMENKVYGTMLNGIRGRDALWTHIVYSHMRGMWIEQPITDSTWATKFSDCPTTSQIRYSGWMLEEGYR